MAFIRSTPRDNLRGRFKVYYLNFFRITFAASAIALSAGAAYFDVFERAVAAGMVILA